MGLMLLLFAMNFGNTMPSLPQPAFVCRHRGCHEHLNHRTEKANSWNSKGFRTCVAKTGHINKEDNSHQTLAFLHSFEKHGPKGEANYTMNTLW